MKDEIRLQASQTKGKHGRTVMVGDRLRKELAVYAAILKSSDPDKPFFYSQRSQNGFNANTLSIFVFTQKNLSFIGLI